MKGEEAIEISNEHNHIPKEEKVKNDEIRKDIKKEFSLKLPKLYKRITY